VEGVKGPGGDLVAKQFQAPAFHRMVQYAPGPAAHITEGEGEEGHQKDERVNLSLLIARLQHPSVKEKRGGKDAEQDKKIVNRVYDREDLVVIEKIPLKDELEHTETPLVQKCPGRAGTFFYPPETGNSLRLSTGSLFPEIPPHPLLLPA